VAGKIADTFNEVIDQSAPDAGIERIVHVVGKEGRITQRASLNNVSTLGRMPLMHQCFGSRPGPSDK